MAEIYKRLGTTTATAATNVFDNGATASTWTIISSITICNTSATAYTYNVSTSASTGTHGAYLASGATIAGNDTVILVAGICLDPTNRYLVAHSSNAAVVITAYGVTGP
jgi:putative cell wall-binding protein